MTDEAGVEDAQLTFNVKSSNDAKYVITVPASTTVADLKAKISTSEYADIPATRQRLIYSGRVLKDPETLASYKIKDGHTVHLVKGADSNARQNPADQGGQAAGATDPTAHVPQNFAAGTGANNPLAGLTGARYAGFGQLPGMDMFGADGGMGAPPNPEQMARMLDDPNFAQQLNEAMNNPQVLEMMRSNPMLRDNPMAQAVLDDPNLRRMMFDPNMIRTQMALQRQFGGDQGAGGSFPAPGATNTTPQNQGQGQGQQGTARTGQPTNPFAAFGGGAAGNNPLAALFGGAPVNAFGTTPGATPPAGSAGQSPPATTPAAGAAGAGQPNPFANLANLMGGAQGGAAGESNPMMEMTRTMMQNPEMMRSMMNLMGGGQGGQGGPGGAGFNPFMMGGPFGGMGGAQQPPQDTRPPEEQYADQLRQLNEMGFYEFDRNVRALRMSGGSVQGAVEILFSGTI